ncbi:hypothetical protein TorRG33x02_023570 [Trema orientale]|uniref:Uncharacterized protein n=1 Tax=Trema orientale TaxID=63057 RepID=A0A2P5FUW2_TREOI|nr:hypothetical protein TorRG33x02_023570 [Trema orientale]
MEQSIIKAGRRGEVSLGKKERKKGRRRKAKRWRSGAHC